MAINHYTPTDGTLTLGSAALDVSGQVRACTVESTENVAETGAIGVLSGEEIAGSTKQTYSFVLAGTMLQDLLAAGVVAWSWSNKGTPQDFTFTPNSTVGGVTAPSITGQLIPAPLNIGGDVLNPDDAYEPAAADFSWRIVGEPVPTWGA